MAFNFPGSAQNIVKIATVNAAAQSTVVFTSGFTSTYNSWRVVITNLIMLQGGGTSLVLNMSTNGGSSYDSGTNYAWTQRWFDSDNNQNSNQGKSGTATSIQLLNPIPETGTATSNAGFNIDLSNFISTTRYKTIYGIGSIIYTNAGDSPTLVCVDQRTAGSYNSTSAVNAIQFSATAGGNITGTFTLYGIV